MRPCQLYSACRMEYAPPFLVRTVTPCPGLRFAAKAGCGVVVGPIRVHLREARGEVRRVSLTTCSPNGLLHTNAFTMAFDQPAFHVCRAPCQA